MKNWNKILKDFSHKCKGGAPDFTNSDHLNLLRESLIKFGWDENATNEFIGNMRTLKVLREPLVEAGGAIPAGFTDPPAKTPQFWVMSADGKKIGKRTKQTKTMPMWATQDRVDKHTEEDDGGDGVVDEKDIVRNITDKKQKSARKNLFGTRGESKGRLHQDRLDQIKKNHPDESPMPPGAYSEYEEDIKQLESLFKEFTDPNTTPERKKEIALQLVTDYGLKTNRSTVNVEDPDNPRPRNVKLYITKLPDGKKVPRWLYKILSGGDGDPSGGGPNGPQSALTNSLNEHLDEENQVQPNSIGGDSESKIAQNFSTWAKPDFKTEKRTKTRPHPGSFYKDKNGNERRRSEKPKGSGMWTDKDGNTGPMWISDPVVTEVMGDPPVSELEDKEPGADSFHSLEGPVDKNGNLIPADTPENKRKHMEWMIKENNSSQKIKDGCKKYIELLKAEKPPNEREIAKFKALKKSIEDHENEMDRILNDYTIPSKEAEEAVKKANGKLMDDIHNAHPEVAGGIAKQIAEVALVQQELAKGEECYLPSAGNFPGGDKLRVTRDGTKVEKVAGVSVKFGRGSKNTQIYGFPAEAASVSKYAEVPRKKKDNGTWAESEAEHKARQKEVRTRSGGKVGQEDHSLGVRDDIVDNPKKQSEIIESSGMGDAIKKEHRAEYHAITKEIKTEVDDYIKKQLAAGKTIDQIEIDLQDHLKDFMSKGKPSLNDRFEEIIDREALSKAITGSEDGTNADGSRHSNSNMSQGCNAIEFLNLVTVGSVIREGQGMPSLSWNHQSYEDGQYHDETVEADDHDMTNLACWGFLSRMYRSSGRAMGGGILTTGTGECEK
jgi:hypothetical protein